MANNNIEIEIQVKIEKSQPLLDFLTKAAEFKFENRQIDEYFTPVQRDFTVARPLKEWFRLRDSSGKYSINYKNWHYDEGGKSNYCDEFETKIEDIDQIRKILSALNFKSIVIVDKVRKVWTYKDYEVAVDSVKSLGDFVEIEYIGKDEKADPKKVTEEMVNFLKNIGSGRIMRNYLGYPFQLLFPGEVKWEEQ
ncbi:MAG: class IV adenylate cyclase [Patescibacteria group bacterium]